MQREGWPEPGSLVVCTVTQVVDFGAFVSLDEYSGKQGLIHISEVASGWIKYIRDHVARRAEDRLQGIECRHIQAPYRSLPKRCQ